jgi:hypothetical protein
VIQALVPGEYVLIVQEAIPGTSGRELTRTNLRITAGARTLLEVP